MKSRDEWLSNLRNLADEVASSIAELPAEFREEALEVVRKELVRSIRDAGQQLCPTEQSNLVEEQIGSLRAKVTLLTGRQGSA